MELQNISEFEFIRYERGPQQLPIIIAVPLNIVYLIIFLVGIFGNLATCMVTIKNPSMQTATNYYLFSLAVSDLIFLILGMPIDFIEIWHRYPWQLGLFFCKISHYILEMSSYVSVLTIMAFSMERYVAICHPFRLHAMRGLKRPIFAILGCWIIGLFSAIPATLNSVVTYIEYPQGSRNMSEKSAMCVSHRFEYPYFEISFVVFFLIPIIMMLVLYIKMGMEIHKSASYSISRHQVSIHFETRQLQARKSIIKMLCAVVVTFFICWAPFHAQRIYSVYSEYASEELFIFSGLSYYMSTAVNPILYNVMSSRYREAFKETIFCILPSVRTEKSTELAGKAAETCDDKA